MKKSRAKLSTFRTDVPSAMPLRGREGNGTSRIIRKSGSSMRRTEGSSQHREGSLLLPSPSLRARSKKRCKPVSPRRNTCLKHVVDARPASGETGQARSDHGKGAARIADRGKRALIARLPDAWEGCRSEVGGRRPAARRCGPHDRTCGDGLMSDALWAHRNKE